MSSDNSTTKSLLASLEISQKYNALPSHAVHPYASAAPDLTVHLQDLISVADTLSSSLSIYETSGTFTNPKLLTLLRQHSGIEYSLHSSDKNISHLISALRERDGVSYGESIPLLATTIPNWCIDRVAEWGTFVGMETFKDDNREGGGVTVVLGGKVLVIDVDFVVDQTDPLLPRLKVSNVKTSNALLAASSTLSTSAFLDSFLMDGITKYCFEMQKPENVRDPQAIAVIRRNLVDQLRYLVLLDQLANRKEDGGLRWFTALDEIYPKLRNLANEEAEAISLSLNAPKVPLDIFLLRGHGLPLPYAIMPSISFLVYLSPAAYLSLTRDDQPKTLNDNQDDYATLDISLSLVKSRLRDLTKGVTLATLFLAKLSEDHLYPASISMSSGPNRPNFVLTSTSFDQDDTFPQIADLYNMTQTIGEAQERFTWVLDFTQGGLSPGVIVSQARMKEIELVVNPLGGYDSMDGVDSILSFGTGSWVDLLLNPGTMASPERYTALYTSPKGLHPPLQLRLTTPQEPGFTLQQVPVHNVKEVFGILEIVKEQCWLNETLLSCHWTIEGLKSEEEDVLLDESSATEEELQSVLIGTFPPRKIPVNVYLPSGSTTDQLFGPDVLEFSGESKPRIVMSSPERPPIPGLVEITVTHDETRPRGIAIDIQGAMGLDLNPADLEEICRRGGTLSLPGRIWASGHGLVT